MTAKRFTARRNDAPPVEFELELIEGDQSRVELFHALPEAPGVALLDAYAGLAGPDDRVDANALMRFMEAVIIDAEVPRFRALCSNKAVVIEAQLLAEIAAWLVGEYADRPTAPLSVS